MSGRGLKVANVMLSRGRGGIEQAFLNYSEALALAGFRPLPVIADRAAIEPAVRSSGFEYRTLPQWGWWDVVAASRLRSVLRREQAFAVITHGNRALSLAQLSAGTAPIIAVVHNYNIGRTGRARAILATTPDLKRAIEERDPGKKLFVVPNVTPVTSLPPVSHPFHALPVIGAMGRMVEKKGFEIFCSALAKLKLQGVRFRSIIAGDGEGRAGLARTIRSLGLDADVHLIGWIENGEAKDAFWNSIDVFCLPSLHEPFGMVILEAWAAGKAIVATDTEGPRSIALDGHDALIVPPNDSDALANALRQLLENPGQAHALAVKGYEKVTTMYSLSVLAKGLDAVIKEVSF